jgi:hypothetical protein
MLKQALPVAACAALLAATVANAGPSTQHAAYFGKTVHMCPHNQGGCSVQTSIANCPPGWVTTGGGIDSPVASHALNVVDNEPVRNPAGWGVVAGNNSNVASSFRAVAMCES